MAEARGTPAATIMPQRLLSSALTTQLYFPGEVRNRTDMLFSPDLLVSVSETANDPASGGAPDPDRAMSVQFDFVIATA